MALMLGNQRSLATAVWLALVLLAAPVLADEIRLKDGEVIHGAVYGRTKGRLVVETATGARQVRLADVEEHLEGEAPHRELARREAALAAENTEGRAELAWFAWRYRLDEAARRLARAAVAIDPDQAPARELLGERREGAGWVRGWAPPWGAAGSFGPRWGEARRRAWGQGRGNAAAKRAVEAGLRWLAAHQDEDGKLDADGFPRHDPPEDRCDGIGGGHHGEPQPCAFDPVTTGVALLAWMSAGSTPISGPYRKHVDRALRWCVQAMEGGPATAYDLWNHAFLTQAVADAYLVTRDPALRQALEREVPALLRHQREDGGFSYYLEVGDVPTTAAVATALGLAAQAGIVIEAGRMAEILTFLDARLERETGRSEYHEGAEHKGYTPTRANAAGALAARAFLGRLADAPLLDAQVKAISDRPPRWSISFKVVKASDGREVRAQIGNLYPYQWYYTTLALACHGGASWSGWFEALQAALAKGQRRDGSARGSWDPLGQYSSSAGRVFITGICVLMLEAPCRYPRP
ncbi:MAG: hypothetical protein JXQ29_12060 [Planctomycetes bacterium]|nr:hypothetical protein [Planctomycetota bacterium]